MDQEIFEKLSVLIRKGDVANVRRILNEQTSFNTCNSNYVGTRSTLLHQAKSGEMVEVLIEHGACVNARDLENRTPLHHAVFNRRDLSVVTSLLKCGANPDARNGYQETPMIVAARRYEKQMIPIVRELVKFGADLNAYDLQGSSAVCVAIYGNYFDLVHELLNLGANIFSECITTRKFITMYSSAFEAAMYCNSDGAKFLIKHEMLKSFTVDYIKYFGMNKYINVKDYGKILIYLEQCASEIMKMISHKIKNYSLYYLVTNSKKCLRPLYLGEMTLEEIASDYPIYSDKIIEKLSPYVERARMLDRLRGLKLTLQMKTSRSDSKTFKEVILNADCLCNIGDFLLNKDLLNFLIVVEKFNESTSDFNDSSCGKDDVIQELSVSELKIDSDPPK